jgi:hypothetical protein
MEDIASEAEYKKQKERVERERLQRIQAEEAQKLEAEKLKANIIKLRNEQQTIHKQAFGPSLGERLASALFTKPVSEGKQSKKAKYAVHRSAPEQARKNEGNSFGLHFGAEEFYGNNNWLSGGGHRKRRKGDSILGGSIFG